MFSLSNLRRVHRYVLSAPGINPPAYSTPRQSQLLRRVLYHHRRRHHRFKCITPPGRVRSTPHAQTRCSGTSASLSPVPSVHAHLLTRTRQHAFGSNDADACSARLDARRWSKGQRREAPVQDTHEDYSATRPIAPPLPPPVVIVTPPSPKPQ